MTEITSFADAESMLARYIPLAQEMTGKDLTLVRMQPLMELIGNPEKNLHIIHVAGTSGKTSTSYYIANLLTLSDKKVGLTVSPHMDSVAERVQIGLKPLDETSFCALLSEFIYILESSDLKPTYYELLMAFAYWCFAKNNVDYAVIETGVGGLQDASNIAIRSDKVCVITDLGFDHMNVLGNTIEEIAAQKAGIIHRDNTAFMYSQGSQVDNVLIAHSKKCSADLRLITPSTLPNAASKQLLDLSEYKQRNWKLAYEVYAYIEKRDALKSISLEDLVKSMKTYVPGRMDEVKIDDKKILMDGAHNEQKMSTFVHSYQQKYPFHKVVVLLAMKKGKEYEVVLKALQPITSSLIITSFSIEQDRVSSSINVNELADYATLLGIQVAAIEPDLSKAYKLFLNTIPSGERGIITGSLYLLSHIRKLDHRLIANI